MRHLCLILSLLLCGSCVMAFPNLNLRFSCPQDNGHLLQLSLQPVGPNKWDANLLETSGDQVIRALGGLIAQFNGIPDEIEISGKQHAYFAVLTQISANEAVYQEKDFHANCRF